MAEIKATVNPIAAGRKAGKEWLRIRDVLRLCKLTVNCSVKRL